MEMKMRVLTCGTGAVAGELRVSRVLDKLHADFGIHEVIRGADENIGSADRAVDTWCRDEGVAQRIFEVIWKDDAKNAVWGDSVFRRNVRMLAAAPDLIVCFDGAEGASPFIDLRLVKTPILLVEENGNVSTFGRGWGEFARARLAEIGFPRPKVPGTIDEILKG
jgi:hypothetical protein